MNSHPGHKEAPETHYPFSTATLQECLVSILPLKMCVCILCHFRACMSSAYICVQITHDLRIAWIQLFFSFIKCVCERVCASIVLHVCVCVCTYKCDVSICGNVFIGGAPECPPQRAIHLRPLLTITTMELINVQTLNKALHQDTHTYTHPHTLTHQF